MKARLFVLAAILGILLFTGCTAGGAVTLSIPSAAAGEVMNPKTALGANYEPCELSISPEAPAYSLPLDTQQIANLQHIESLFQLTGERLQLLQQNGFVVMP